MCSSRLACVFKEVCAREVIVRIPAVSRTRRQLRGKTRTGVGDPHLTEHGSVYNYASRRVKCVSCIPTPLRESCSTNEGCVAGR